jgi:hypothetical protein
VRLVPDGAAETVWGTRIDPARTLVQNVPMPESDRRYGDIILNDGAEEGKRISKGIEYPVLNELGLWQISPYSTFSVEVEGATSEAAESLDRIVSERGCAFEDWGTIRILCAACSKGNPGEHACTDKDPSDRPSRFGMAVRSMLELDAILRSWREVEPDLRLGEAKLEVCGLWQ